MNYFEDPPLSWHHLLEVLRDGVAHIDEHGVICHTNERLEAMSGPPLPSPKLDSTAMQFAGAVLQGTDPSKWHSIFPDGRFPSSLPQRPNRLLNHLTARPNMPTEHLTFLSSPEPLKEVV